MVISSDNICTSDRELIVIPHSVDGFMRIDFENLLRELNLYTFVPAKSVLGNTFQLVVTGHEKLQYIILACTNENNHSGYSYARRIVRALGQIVQDFRSIPSIGIPVLGAGGGGLNPVNVVAVMEKTFKETTIPLSKITYYSKEGDGIDKAKIDQLVDSKRSSVAMAFEYTTKDLLKEPWVMEMMGFEEFYHQLGQDKLQEFLEYQPLSEGLFQRLYDQFVGGKEVFQHFIKRFADGTEERTVLTLAGELVAYMDSKAYNKERWNKYADKRTVARSGVNQTNWISNLLFLRAENNNYSTLSPSILNAVNFLRYPDTELCMLSEAHRKLVCEHILEEKYNQETFTKRLIFLFDEFEAFCVNPKNSTILITRILYSQDIEILWERDKEPKTSYKSKNTSPLTYEETIDISIKELVRKQNMDAMIHSDVYAKSDLLNYEAYASVIASFVTSGLTQPPLTIGVMAPWGKGKTSLMRFIEKKIQGNAEQLKAKNEEDKSKKNGKDKITNWNFWNLLKKADEKENDENKLSYPTIWFNAWKFQKNQQIWAGLAHEIITQLAERLPPIKREAFYLRLNLKRIDKDQLRLDIFKKALNKVVLPLLVATIAVLLSLSILSVFPLRSWHIAVPYIKIGGFALFLGHSIINVVSFLMKTPGADLARYIKNPEYKKDMGYYSAVEEDLRQALSILINKEKPPIVFIDDLDRCSPSTISELIEAINLFISGDISNCYFIIGQDAQMVAASLEASYDKIGEKLGDVGKKHGSFGWYFMEKFIQLQFNLPVITKEQSKNLMQNFLKGIDLEKVPSEEVQKEILEEYTKIENSISTIDDLNLLFTPRREKLESELFLFNASRVIEFQDKLIAKAVSRFSIEESALENVIVSISPLISNSPRIMKRFANLFIFYQFMKYSNSCKGLRMINDDVLGNWLLIMIKWPQLVREIQWDSEKSFLNGNNATNRAEDFERLILDSENFDQYLKSLKKRNINGGWWPCNRELYEYFKNNGNEESSLAKAVSCGLW